MASINYKFNHTQKAQKIPKIYAFNAPVKLDDSIGIEADDLRYVYRIKNLTFGVELIFIDHGWR